MTAPRKPSIPSVGTDSTGTHLISGGSYGGHLTSLATDPLVGKALSLLDSSVPLPLAGVGWSKVAWCTRDDLASAERMLRDRGHVDLADQLKKLRLKMRRRGLTRVLDMTLGQIVECVR